MKLKDFTKLKEEINELDRRLERAKGGRKEILRTLKEQFGCSSAKDAKEILTKLTKKLGSKKERMNDELEQLKRDFPEVFEEES